jgi:hypothetical protein
MRRIPGSIAPRFVLAVALCTALQPVPGHAAEPPATSTLSFCQPPFVHPLVIKDLLAWMSDSGDQVVAINLTDANDSNRYYGEIKTRGSGKLAPKHPLVVSTVEESEGTEKSRETVGYEYVGLTSSGLHVLRTWEEGDGTLVPTRLLFLSVEEDQGLADMEIGKGDGTLRLARKRLLLRKIGELALGDRWAGALRIDGNKILVGRDQGQFAHNPKDIVLRLEDSAKRPGVLRPCH